VCCVGYIFIFKRIDLVEIFVVGNENLSGVSEEIESLFSTLSGAVKGNGSFFMNENRISTLLAYIVFQKAHYINLIHGMPCPLVALASKRLTFHFTMVSIYFFLKKKYAFRRKDIWSSLLSS